MLSQSIHNHTLPRAELTLANAGLSRGGHPIFAGLSLTLCAQDLMWVGGDNGIGKSSLLRLMTGLSRADTGSVSWTLEGQTCAPSDVIAYQGHQDAFKPQLSAAEALSFWAGLMNSPQNSKADIAALLQTVGLGARTHVPCGQLSAGQKRRLSLARLILSQKPIWILDEPTAAMDAAGVTLIHGLIAAHIKDGGSAVIASHRAPVIAALRTRQMILKAASGQKAAS